MSENSAPKDYPNLSRAGMGRPRVAGRVRVSTSIGAEAKQFLVKMGGGPNRIGAAIEKLVNDAIESE